MGNNHSVQKINFEYMQEEINDNRSYIISTLPIDKQECLILGTLTPDREVEILNANLKSNTSIKLIVYAMNACDESLAIKCHQLLKLGFSNLYVYAGGLFEWLLLQDIYGEELFPTTMICSDHLKFKGNKSNRLLLVNK
tara:strand:- start:1332 stop:1748 length:417 start_codon:yes stop_codon:yes gene_type:complete